MQEVERGAVTIPQALELFGPLLIKHQGNVQSRLLTAALDELGVQISWYVAPKGHYLFFAPKYRATYKWRELSAWYPFHFQVEIVTKLKALASRNKWPMTKVPVLAGLNVEALSGIGSKYEGWNELVEVKEYVLPLKANWIERLHDYLNDWERTFTPYVLRPLEPGTSPTVASANSELSTALLATPFTTDPARIVNTAKECIGFMRDVLSGWSAADVVKELHTQDVFPALLRLDRLPVPLADRARIAWEKLYELRVEFLETYPLPWFYEHLLDALGAQGEKRGQSAGDIVDRGARPLMPSVIPAELHGRVAKVASALEREFPILVARPMEGLAV